MRPSSPGLGCAPLILTRIFWILFGVEAWPSLVLMVRALLGSKRRDPEGPVGTWLIAVTFAIQDELGHDTCPPVPC